MKDIDFDELDKAVNSLMATTPAAQPSDTSSVQPLAPTPQAPKAETVPVTTAPAAMSATAVPAPQPAVESRPAAPASRRGGRFMDMVHSSSDMKPRDTATAPSREGLAITPRAETPKPSEAEPETAPPVNVSQPEAPVTMPDPLDLVVDEAETVAAPAPESSQQAATTPDPIDLGGTSSESPFLSDAKVEKRPLNAAPSPATNGPTLDLSSELNESYETPDEPSPDTQSAHADEPPATPVVPELSSDLVAIESNEASEVTQAVDSVDAAAQVPKPQPPLGAASIAPQYTAQESSGDQSHAAIYDSSQYPEPMSHPAKSKSGWLWVVWVLLLLGLGAGTAVLLYNFGIIP